MRVHPLFTAPMHITNRSALDKFLQKLSEIDITSYVLKARPNTHWQPVMVTNVRYYATTTGYTLGSAVQLPEYIKNRTSIISLCSTYGNHKSYNDNLCLFRNIALCLEDQELYKSEKTYIYKYINMYIYFFLNFIYKFILQLCNTGGLEISEVSVLILPQKSLCICIYSK